MYKEMDFLEEEIKKYTLYLAHERGKEEALKKREEELHREKKELKESIDLLEKVNLLFQRTSEFARNQAKTQVENLVTKCLEFVFDDSISFKIEIEELRGRANARFLIVSEMEGKEISMEPELSKGGGVVDVVSLALRIAFLEIHSPKIMGPLILDEPAKHVSAEYIYNVSEFLRRNSELFNRQIIMVTHNDYLASIGTSSYTVKIEDGISSVQHMEV